MCWPSSDCVVSSSSSAQNDSLELVTENFWIIISYFGCTSLVHELEGVPIKYISVLWSKHIIFIS